MPSPHWHILGSGALGGLLATQLVAAGQPVSLLLRDNQHQAELQEAGGIRLNYADNDTTFPITAEILPSQSIQHLLVATKAHDALTALKALQGHFHSKPQIILLQNGLGLSDQIKYIMPQSDVFNAISLSAAYRIKRFHICAITKGPLWIGANKPQIDLPNWFVHLQQADPKQIHWDSEIYLRQWEKLAINCAINPLSALLNCRNGQLLNSVAAKHIMQHVCQEVELLMQTKGIMQRQALLPLAIAAAESTANNYSSMQQDFQHDRLTEIDYINAYVMNEGKKWGLTLPYNQLLCELIKARYR